MSNLDSELFRERNALAPLELPFVKRRTVLLVFAQILILATVFLLYFLLSRIEPRKAIVVLGGIILLPVALYRPFFGFLLFIIGLPFLKANIHVTPHFDIGAVDLFVMLYVFIYALKSLTVPEQRRGLVNDKFIIVAASVYLGALLIGSMYHYVINDVYEPQALFYYVKNRFVYLALYFVTLAIVRSESNLKKCCAAVGIAGIVMALYALKDVALLRGSFDMFDAVEGVQSSRLVAASAQHSNVVAQHFVMTIPVLFFMMLMHPSRKIKALGFAGAIICLIGLFLTFARSAWIATFLAISLFMFKRKVIGIRFLLALGILGISLVLATHLGLGVSLVGLVVQRFKELETSQFSERPEIWLNTLMLIRQCPFWGVGLGSFEASYWLETAAISPRIHAHNVFLFISAESGLIAGIAFGAFIVKVLYNSLCHLLKSDSGRPSYVYCGLFAALVGMMMMFMVENVFFSRLNASLFFIELGLITAFLRDIANPTSQRETLEE